MPYNHICNCGAGRYVGSNGIYIQVLQFLCQITVDCVVGGAYRKREFWGV